MAGAYRPADYAASSYAFTNGPVGPYGTNLDVFSGIVPNGVWSLYAYDNSPGDSGGISNGWGVTITTITPVSKSADLAASIALATSSLTLSNQATFLLSVTNNGPNAASAYLTNILPAGVTFVSTSAAATNYLQTGSTVLYSLGTLNVGEGVTITNVVEVDTGGQLTDTIIAASALPDPDTANNTASITTAVNLPSADIAAGIGVTTSPAVSGLNLVYTLYVTNLGPNTAVDVSGLFTLTNLTYVAASPASDIAGINGQGALVCDFGTVLAGQTASVAVTAVPSKDGLWTNSLSITSSNEDSNLNNNLAYATILVTNPGPVIASGGQSLSGTNGAFNSDEVVTVSLTLTNIGSASTTNLVATLQSNPVIIPITTSQTYGAIAPGTSAIGTFTFTATGAPARPSPTR